MKRLTQLTLLLTLLICMSCNKEDKPTKNTISGVTNLMDDGFWRITYFKDGDDKTSNFADFSFKFEKDNLLTASNNSVTNNGIWSITDDNAKRNNLDELHFNISFLSPEYFEDLTGDWDFMTKTETRVELFDNHSGGTHYLTFEKK